MDNYQLEDVFKLSGVPEVTFVEPVEFSRLLVALRTKGRGVVIEGPSGIGKTSAVTKALARLEPQLTKSTLRLSARRRDDRELIAELPNIESAGVVVIDDFHRLDQTTRLAIADHLKVLADEEREDTKIVVIGINRAGESLLSFAPDLSGRIEVIKFEVNPDDRVKQLIDKGSLALNVEFPVASDIIQAADGSFNIAQMLCHDACLTAGVTETSIEHQVVNASYELVRERVLDRLAGTFYKRAEVFAKGKKLRREGRAPYLQILRWLSLSDEWTIDLDREMSKHPTLRGSVSQVVEKGHLENLLDEQADLLGDLLHYDADARVLAVEDPKFFYFIKNLAWNRFAERIGYFDVSFSTRYDFALSFAGSDRDIAELLFNALSELEHGVFYDKEEQARILAENVEEYLAPIYKSEASFVVAILGPDYPKRIWTKFESEQFKKRFGEKAVIPIWFTGQDYGAFDISRDVGGETVDRSQLLEPQVTHIAERLAAKLTAHRLAGSSSTA
ncbi:TIR domain-containing protein [Cellulomonas cellasea]|uniref:TIR domain-containing protein n=1 Tax=Cellulomonas cellasea TaxID=43670 RepID=UPI0025A48E1C|nr:TIR domain-containing protein [Cellulomonas cellasea]MDM8084358.1 TIR domain-containing protein [Cellulomonas cellasea]